MARSATVIRAQRKVNWMRTVVFSVYYTDGSFGVRTLCAGYRWTSQALSQIPLSHISVSDLRGATGAGIPAGADDAVGPSARETDSGLKQPVHRVIRGHEAGVQQQEARVANDSVL